MNDPTLTSSLIPHPSSPLAVSLLTPTLAAIGAGLIAIPILIHLLNRRRFRTVEWAAMRFVLAAMRRNRRRLRFESWLLLALRCAVLAIAGLALARPIGCADSALAAAAGAGREAGLHVVVVDNSGSTAAPAGNDATVLDRLREAAAATVEFAGSGGGRVAAFAAAAPSADVVPAPVFDSDAAAAAVRDLPQTSSTTDLAGAMEAAVEAIETYAGDDPARPTLHVFTDNAAAALADPRLAELGPRAAAVADVNWYVPDDPTSNAAVVALATGDRLVRRGFDVDLAGRVASFGGSASLPATWTVDGRTFDTITADASAEPAAVAAPPSLADAVADGRAHVVALRLPSPSGVPGDDERRLVVEQVRRLPTLLVEGAGGDASAAGGVSLVEAALSPGGGAGPVDYVGVERIGDLELAGRALDDYRAVILDGVGGIGEATAAQLAGFVRGGGALLIFAGESTTADNYNTRLAPLGLLPGTLARRVSAGDDVPFALDVDPRQPHRYLAAFRGAGETGVDRPVVLQYWQLDLADDRDAEVVADFAGTGDPAIVTHPLGEGRVVTVATAAADPQWTALPATPAFPAVLHELLRGAVGDAGAAAAWQTAEVGDVVRLPATFDVPAGATPTILGGEGATGFRREVGPDGSASWIADAPPAPGVYEVQAGGASVPLVVNFPAVESDTRPADAAAVRAALGDAGVNVVPLSADLATIAAAGDEADGRDWGWPLLVAVLALAACEAAFAAHVGRRRG